MSACIALLQATPSSSLVAFLKAQGLSPLMRQYIMYAVAMADSDQELLSTQNTSTNAPSQAAKRRPTATQSVAQPGTNASEFDTTEPSSAAPSAPSAPQTAPATHPRAASAAEVICSGAASMPTASHLAHARRPETVQLTSSPQCVADTSTTQPTSQESRPHARPSASPQPVCQSVAAGVPSDSLMTIEEGVKALRQYMSSVGRYGPNSGAILTPMYGCAELPQAFCR